MAKFGLSVLQMLETPFHRQRISRDEGVVIEPLAGDVDDTHGTEAAAFGKGWHSKYQYQGEDQQQDGAFYGFPMRVLPNH